MAADRPGNTSPSKISNREPIYNSRIARTYLTYLELHYTSLDRDDLLRSVGMSREEVDDPAHWFSQEQMDRFHEFVVLKTGDPGIARKTGRFAASSETVSPLRQYLIGFVTPVVVYGLIEKIAPNLTRASNYRAKKLARNRIELSVTPRPGVTETKYQCENRLGLLEAVGMVFLNQYPRVEHSECIHRDGKSCRYLVSWELPVSFKWRIFRNYLSLAALAAFFVLFFVLPHLTWVISVASAGYLILVVSTCVLIYEKEELSRNIRNQGDVANLLMDEMRMRYHTALLVQKVGEASASIMDEQALVTAVLCVVEQHLDYDRGMILLADSSRARLKWIAGYGFDAGQKKLLESISFELDSENAKGFFQTVFLEKDPVVLNGISDFSNLFSHCPEAYQQRMSCDSMIAVAVVSEEKLLGVLVVENLKRKRTLTRSDVNLLEGIASETALGILKARSIKQLKASEKKYRELVENANSIILRCDIEGRVTFFNEFGQKLFGYEDFEILGKSMFGTVFPDNESNRELFDRQMKALRDNPEHPRANESECRTRTGQVTWIAWTYRPIFDAKGRLCEILCIGNDVTEIRRADIENRELQVRLERAKKMEALGTLAGGVAHDLNNVLSGVVAYPDLLLLELPEDSPFRRSILTIQKSGRKAAAIVEDLLTLARRGVVNKEVLDLNRLVNDYLESPVFENLHSYYSEVEVNKNLDEALFRIQGSPVHLTKMIMNLVSNAAEAIDGPGKIVVATRNRYVDRTLKGFEAVEEGMYVEFSVEDNGKGIEESAREHIFEPFYSKKVLGRSGTGLGMAVVWGTVKDHNGYIDIKSEVGRGTSVSVYIPVSVDQVLKEKHVESIDRLSGSGQKVLVVDDMEDQRFIASSMLEKLGYAAVTVSSGEEALEYLEWNPVDCVLLDMIMTGSMDGLDTFRRMRDIRPGLKTVIVSGFSETERVKEAQKLGAGPYVRKPYLLQTLGRILKRELSGEPDVQEDPGPGAS